MREGEEELKSQWVGWKIREKQKIKFLLTFQTLDKSASIECIIFQLSLSTVYSRGKKKIHEFKLENEYFYVKIAFK